MLRFIMLDTKLLAENHPHSLFVFTCMHIKIKQKFFQ